VAILGCGLLQVSDPGRFARRRPLPWWVDSTLHDISRAYLGASEACELADPLLILEQAQPAQRALPAIFAFAGTKDPVLDDTRRLAHALARLKVHHAVHYYPGELHAFHALVFREAARHCWRAHFAFLEATLAVSAVLERELSPTGT
jgi:acetyl esterase